MIWKFLKQNVLSPKGLNWVQHLVSRIGLLIDALKLEPNLYKKRLEDVDDPCLSTRYIRPAVSFQGDISKMAAAMRSFCVGTRTI